MSDWDPGEEFVEHVLSELVPMVQDSDIMMSILPSSESDVKFAVELGISLMLDKPLILVVFPGRVVPDHIRRVSDAIVEFDPDDYESTQRRITDAMARIKGGGL